MTTIRVENLIAKKNAEYPEKPARDVCNGSQNPVTTRAGNSVSVRIRKLCDSTDENSLQQHTTIERPVGTYSIKTYMGLKSRKV